MLNIFVAYGLINALLLLCFMGSTLYILGSLGLMKIAERKGIENAWLAWVPVGNRYVMGKLTLSEKMTWVFVGLSALLFFETASIGSMSFMMALMSIAWYGFCLYTLYQIYEALSEKAVVMIIFTILSFGLLAPIFLFVIRHNKFIEQHARAGASSQKV